MRLAADVIREEVSADGVACEWMTPKNSVKHHILLYLHGGGFVYGLTPLHYKMVATLVEKLGMRALLVDYRLAPRYPFPAPLEDCVTAYRWLLKQGISANSIVVAGDSAGGNLALSMLMQLRDAKDPLPVAAACLSPVADLTDRAHLFKELRDPLLHPRSVKLFNKSYVGEHDPRDPLVSPVFGDWRGLPPLLVHAGEDEILSDDAVRIGEVATVAGVDVQVVVYPRMWHVWQLYAELPQTAQSLDHIATFLRTQLGRPHHHQSPG